MLAAARGPAHVPEGVTGSFERGSGEVLEARGRPVRLAELAGWAAQA